MLHVLKIYTEYLIRRACNCHYLQALCKVRRPSCASIRSLQPRRGCCSWRVVVRHLRQRVLHLRQVLLPAPGTTDA